MYCDCIEAINEIIHHDQGIAQHLLADQDLITKTIISLLPVAVTFHWIKGHYQGPDRTLMHDFQDVTHSYAHSFLTRDDPTYKTCQNVIVPLGGSISFILWLNGHI